MNECNFPNKYMLHVIICVSYLTLFMLLANKQKLFKFNRFKLGWELVTHYLICTSLFGKICVESLYYASLVYIIFRKIYIILLK